MRFNRIFIFVAAVSFIFFVKNPAFCQAVVNSAEQTITGPEQKEAPAADETQWVWGEVVSLDAAKNQVVIKYLDYENDMEKEITITADAKTAFENMASLAELKPKDTVSVDYIVTPDGSNIAKNVTIEKPEEGEMSQQKEAPAPAAAAAPAATSEQNQQQGSEAGAQPEQPKVPAQQ